MSTETSGMSAKLEQCRRALKPIDRLGVGPALVCREHVPASVAELVHLLTIQLQNELERLKDGHRVKTRIRLIKREIESCYRACEKAARV